MRIAFLLQGSGLNDYTPHVSFVTQEIIERLHEKGANIDLLVSEEKPLDMSEVHPCYDLYVLKSKTPLALSLAGALTAAGANVVNTFRSTMLAKDKIVSTAVLSASDIPVPPSWATGQPSCLLPLLEEGALWIKPPHGSRGRGIRRVNIAADMNCQEPPVDAYGLPLSLFAQREVPSGGRDLKVYVVGNRVWAITRPWPARTMEDKIGLPASLPPEIQSAALSSGKALGLELYGVDFLVMEDRFFVVDVNAFPGFKGALEAPFYLAEYIYERADGLKNRNI